MTYAKRKARVQTSVIRREPRHPSAEAGRFNPVSNYGALTITDSVVRAGTTRGHFSGMRVYQFPRWDFIKGRATGVPHVH